MIYTLSKVFNYKTYLNERNVKLLKRDIHINNKFKCKPNKLFKSIKYKQQEDIYSNYKIIE